MRSDDMTATTETYTYMRAAVPADKTGQCPCCLKDHRSSERGTLVRHGWKEMGRIVGSYGNGYQFGNCNGWGKRPLEQTDADGLVILAGLVEEIKRTRDAIKLHTKGADSYMHTVTVSLEYDRDDKTRAAKVARYEAALKAHGVEFTSRETKERKQGIRVYYAPAQLFTLTIKRRAAKIDVTREETEAKGSLTYARDSVAFTVPSYEMRRASVVAELESIVKSLERQREAIKAAIKHHHDNPSNGGKDTKKRGKLVHLELTVVRSASSCAPGTTLEQRTSKRLACGKRANTMTGLRMHLLKTEDRSKVTCEKCKAAK
jgi:hypothetical protein